MARPRPAEPVLLRVPRARPVHGRAVDRRPEAPAGPHRAHRRQGRRSARTCRNYVDGRPGRAAAWTRRSTRPSRRQRPAVAQPGARRRRPTATAAARHGAGHGRPSKPGQRHAPPTGASSSSTTAPSSIASITSCTNTSNPSVMLAAALLAKNAVEQGPDRQAVGQDLDGARARKVVTDYYEKAGLWPVPGEARLPPGRLRLHDLHRQLRPAAGGDLRGGQRATTSPSSSVLSGNRNFEGRINPDVKMNYLASPPLVIAYALAGTMDFDFETEPLGTDDGRQRRLPARTSGRRRPRSQATIDSVDRPGDVHQATTPTSSPATSAGSRLPTPEGDTFAWDAESTYVRKPPYFDGMTAEPAPVTRHHRRPGARQARRLGHHRPHQPGRLDQGRQPGRAVPRPSTASSARTSTPTARAAATTR